MHLTRLPRPHGRPWSGAFNVVMATAIVSVAARAAGAETISIVLLWLAVAAFAPLAVLDVGRAQSPLALLHVAGDPHYGIPAFGFVADACVLGARLVAPGGAGRIVAVALLVCAVAVWAAIAIALVRGRGAGGADRPRAEWLLAVVATEGLAILAAELARTGFGQPLRVPALAVWALGGVEYLVLMTALARRLRIAPLHPGELTPGWWIVPGGAAIFAVGAVSVHGGDVAALAGWALATLAIPIVAAGRYGRHGGWDGRGSRPSAGRWCSRWACTASPGSWSVTRPASAGS